MNEGTTCQERKYLWCKKRGCQICSLVCEAGHKCTTGQRNKCEDYRAYIGKPIYRRGKKRAFENRINQLMKGANQ